MGVKGFWFCGVKQALNLESKEKKDKQTRKSKRWFGKQKREDRNIFPQECTLVAPPPRPPPPPPPPLPPPVEEVKLKEAENEQSQHAYSVAFATAVAAEVAVAAAQAAAEVVRLTSTACYSGKSKEEIAAIKIQTAFRGYLARRALRALRGLVRLKTMIQGHSVRRQATTTLKCMQTLARVQAQIRARRIRMSEENQAIQRQLEQKREREAEKLRVSMGEEWDDSIQSKEQIEANLQSKKHGAIRRERALAYAYSHQEMRRNSSKSSNPTFMDLTNPHWGWSWLERWMAARPWETTDRERNGSEHTSVKSGASHRGGSNKPSPRTNRCSPKTRPASPRVSGCGTDDESRSLLSTRSERLRRHSIAGSSMRDDESQYSSPAMVPSYMVPTVSAKARSRLPSPSPLSQEKNGPTEKGSVKKRLSFSAASSPSGNPRRHSDPPKVDNASAKDVTVNS